MDRLIEFVDELRENWDDHYWWARHQVLQAVALALIVGAIGVGFTYLEERVKLTNRLKELTPDV